MKKLRRRNKTVIERMESFIMPEPNTGCWIWLARLNSNGYGVLTVDGKKWKAHRLCYSIYKGPIPLGLNVCHHCDNPYCVNPDHMFVGTTQDNIADKIKKKRHNYGIKVPQSKITPIDVRIIREAWREFGRGSQSKIGSYFGLTQQGVSCVINRHWRSV